MKHKNVEFSRLIFHCCTMLSNPKERETFFFQGKSTKKITIQTGKCGPSSIHLVRFTCTTNPPLAMTRIMDPVVSSVEYYVDMKDLAESGALKCTIPDMDPAKKSLVFRVFDTAEYLKHFPTPNTIYSENTREPRVTVYEGDVPAIGMVMPSPPPVTSPQLFPPPPPPVPALELIRMAMERQEEAKREMERMKTATDQAKLVEAARVRKRKEDKEALLRRVVKQMARSKFVNRCRMKMKEFKGPCLLCFESMTRPGTTRKIAPCYHTFHRTCYGNYEWEWVQKRKDTPAPCPRCVPKPAAGRRGRKS